MTDKFFQGTYRTNTTYPRYSIVVDGNSANKLLYIATQDVPRNTPLNATSYWIKYDVENGAINPEEILAMIEEITGDLDDLTTEDKTNLVSAINELVSRPTPVQADWEQSDSTALDFIKNKPTITPQVQADWDEDDSTALDFIKNKPTITPQEQADWDEDDPDSVSYIQNKPTIPPSVTVDDALSMTSVNPVQNKVITSKLSTVLGVPTDPGEQPINFSFSQPIPFHNPTGKQKILQCVTYSSNNEALYVEIIVEPNPNYPLEFDYLDFYLGINSQRYDSVNNALCLIAKNNASATSHFKATFYKYSQTGTLYGSYSVNQSALPKSSNETDFECGQFVQSSGQVSTRISNITKATSINCEFKSGRAFFSTYISIAIPPILAFTINGELPKTPWEQMQEKVTALEDRENIRTYLDTTNSTLYITNDGSDPQPT